MIGRLATLVRDGATDRGEDGADDPGLLEVLLRREEAASMDPAERRLFLRSLALERSGEVGEATRLADLLDGWGPLSPLIEDPEVTDIFVNGCDDVWVGRSAAILRSSIAFTSVGEIRALIDRMLAGSGKRVDRTRPLVDARLDDGSRLHVVLPPVAPAGPLLSIRRFRRDAMELKDLVEKEMLDQGTANRLREAVVNRHTILISGRTGAGKTTLLGALLRLVGPSERVALLEETEELPPIPGHVVRLVGRSPNVEGLGEVTLVDLVRASLRMGPDRIVIGEVRGAEALAALSALSTGHRGSLLTIHAGSATGGMKRLMALALSASGAPSERLLNEQVEEAIDVCVHLDRDQGLRRVSEVVHRR